MPDLLVLNVRLRLGRLRILYPILKNILDSRFGLRILRNRRGLNVWLRAAWYTRRNRPDAEARGMGDEAGAASGQAREKSCGHN